MEKVPTHTELISFIYVFKWINKRLIIYFSFKPKDATSLQKHGIEIHKKEIQIKIRMRYHVSFIISANSKNY